MADSNYININLKSDLLKYNTNINNKSIHQIGGKKFDIKLKTLSKQISTQGFETSNLIINFSGNSINHVIVNTLKRIILTLIPVYAFDPVDMIFGQNTSIFNNDYMRLRLSNFPLYFSTKHSIKELNNIKTLEEAKILDYRANIGSKEIDETTLLDLKFERDNFMMTVNVKNNSPTDIMDVETTTPGVNFYWNNEKIDHPYDLPLLIIQLKPNEVFNVTCKSSLNIALKNAIYRCCTLCYYNQNNENDYDFHLHSRRQIYEKEILLRACKILIQKVQLSISIIIKNIKDKELDDLFEGTIEIDGEYHTLSNLITRFLQDHDNIEFAGYAIGHPSVAMVKIEYISRDKISKILNDIQKEIISVYSEIMDQIENL